MKLDSYVKSLKQTNETASLAWTLCIQWSVPGLELTAAKAEKFQMSPELSRRDCTVCGQPYTVF